MAKVKRKINMAREYQQQYIFSKGLRELGETGETETQRDERVLNELMKEMFFQPVHEIWKIEKEVYLNTEKFKKIFSGFLDNKLKTEYYILYEYLGRFYIQHNKKFWLLENVEK